MLTKRIIPCLDVKAGRVVKGVRFKGHEDMGDVLELSKNYVEQGADELVFYEITASAEGRVVDRVWIEKLSRELDIPFCVAGGIRSVADARMILKAGADKISVNSPALERPQLIAELAAEFGSQCVTVGVDSRFEEGIYTVFQYTGNESKTQNTRRQTLEWIEEAQSLGAGEIVLNCMDQDGVRKGYDLEQLSLARRRLNIPLIASGGAGCVDDFRRVFLESRVDGALAASVFHKKILMIPDLKQELLKADVAVRL